MHSKKKATAMNGAMTNGRIARPRQRTPTSSRAAADALVSSTSTLVA